MDLGIGNRVAMVAASSKGLGRAVAESLAKEGCRLSICSRSIESLEPARQSVEALGAEVLPVACDVSKAEDLERWFGDTVARFGQVDIVVTNTGGPPAARVMNLSEEQWRSGIDSTLMNVVPVSPLAIEDMRKRRSGRLVPLPPSTPTHPT